MSATTVLESWPLTGMGFVRGELQMGFNQAGRTLSCFLTRLSFKTALTVLVYSRILPRGTLAGSKFV